MANTTVQFTPDAEKPDEAIEVNLREPLMAALLAWVLPGLGHLYQGRTGKGLLFFICVFGTFVYGMYLGGGKVVYASVSGDPQYRWQYWCQLGIGAPALPALVQSHRVENKQLPLWRSDKYPQGFMGPPRQQPMPLEDDSGNTSWQPNEQAMWIADMHPYFELGTHFTVIAGLLNILVICDAYAGPLVLASKEKKESDEE